MGSGEKYTGINRFLKSKFVQTMMDKYTDGTYETFLDDWKWIFSYSRRHKKAIALYLLMGILNSTLSLGSTVVSKYLIDIIVGKELGKLWILALPMAFSTLFSLVFSSLANRTCARISIDVHNDIQADIFEKIVSADWMELNKFANGDILNRFNSDVGTVSGNAVTWLPTLIINLYTFGATFCVILYYDVAMAFIALLSAPFLLLTGRYIMGKMRQYRERMLETNSRMMSFEVETFYNMDTIKSFGVAERFKRELNKWQGKYREHTLDYNLFSIRANIINTGISTLVAFVAFGYCLFRLWTDSISYGTMTLFLQQRSVLSGRFSSLVGIIPGMLSSAVSAHRIREIIGLPREVHDPEGAEQLKSVAGARLTVRMRDVDFSYDPERTVITGGDFVAKPGEIVALVGPSGGGKTTLIRMILGLIRPGGGGVTLCGQEGKELEITADIRQFFSYVPQGNTMLAGTIAENLRMVKEDATDEEIIRALETTCAWDFVKKLPDTIHTSIGERGKGLSEGQAQRIAIARAVLRDAPVLLLDEATSALDATTEARVLRNIIRRHPSKTCIVTTHRPSVLGMCQRAYRVKEGTVTELTPEESCSAAEN